MMMESADVTHIAVDALLKGKASVVPGFRSALAAQAPSQLAAMMAERFMTLGSDK